MTWLSHTTIATAVALPFNPAAIPIAVAGSTAPDWMEGLLKPFMPHLKHRKETHYLFFWIFAFALSFLIDYRDILFWFTLGGITHILADSLTISGVPLSPWSKTKFHLFGGALKESSFYKFRTGGQSEYIIAFSMLVIAIMLNNPINMLAKDNHNNFNPYMFNYRELHSDKIIDSKEYKENRFNFF